MRISIESMDVEPVLEREGVEIDQAAVFLEDAVKYRSIHHKIDKRSLRIYRIYYSSIIRWGLTFLILLDLGLAFFENPSSLTISSDPRYCGPRPEAPCGVLEVIEIICLLCFVCDVITKSHFLGRRQLIKNRWMLAYMSVLVISFVDVFVSLSSGCKEVVRIRRILRPFFLLQNSSLMKKLLRAIKRTLPEIMSVLFLLFLHLFFFTMFGMLLFPRKNVPNKSKNQTLVQECKTYNTSDSGAICEGGRFFKDLKVSMRSLFVLLTTANNPDVMMPAYMKNRFYATYFLLFTAIGLFCFLNLLTAVIYNQFRGYLMKSLQSSLFRRRVGVRAAFEVMCKLSIPDNDAIFLPTNFTTKQNVRQVIDMAKLGKRNTQLLRDALIDNTTGRFNAKEFQDLFDVLGKRAKNRFRPAMSFVGNPFVRRFQVMVAHNLFGYFGDFIAGVNVIFVSAMLDAQYDNSINSTHAALSAVNFFFVLYYLFEQSAKLWALGWQRYVSFKGNVYCGAVTLLLVTVEVIFIIIHGPPFGSSDHTNTSYSIDNLLFVPNLIRIINMLIIFRLLRIIPNIKALSLIAETLMNLLHNLTPFAGLIVAIYYIFAILGMMLFANVTDPSPRCDQKENSTTAPCTKLEFDTLEYYANNFNDFAASLVLLWDIMVVNNWHVFLKAYAALVNSWAQLYFLAWYLVSVIISLNLFVALILEAFVNQWERRQRRRNQSATQTQDDQDPRFYQMFSSALDEPQEAEILAELRSHEHLDIIDR